jgi:uncharacterized protein (TIGR03067 family)
MNTEDSATKKDLEGIQGTWSLVSAMEDGRSLAGDKVKETTVIIKDDTFRFPQLAEDATSKAGTFKLDATKKPKQIDTVSTEKEAMLGIYELEGYGYKVCFAPVGKPRPSEFTSQSGSGNILQVWEREKSRSRSAEI